MKNHVFIPAIVVLLASLNGCFFGPSKKEFAVLLGPEGASVTLGNTAGFHADGLPERQRLQGELMEVHDEGLVLLARLRPDQGAPVTNVLVLVPFTLVEEGAVTGRGGIDHVNLEDGKRPGATALRHLRQLSRYPYGMPDEAEARLLAHLGQDIIYQVKPHEP